MSWSYIPINPANADRSEGVGEGGWRGGGRRRGEDEMGRGRRRGEMREARRRDHARRGAEARLGRTDGRELRPRRPHQDLLIHSFSGVVLQILLFGIHLVAADGMHFI